VNSADKTRKGNVMSACGMYLCQNSVEWRAFVNAVMNVRFESHARNYRLIEPVTSVPV